MLLRVVIRIDNLRIMIYDFIQLSYLENRIDKRINVKNKRIQTSEQINNNNYEANYKADYFKSNAQTRVNNKIFVALIILIFLEFGVMVLRPLKLKKLHKLKIYY